MQLETWSQVLTRFQALPGNLQSSLFGETFDEEFADECEGMWSMTQLRSKPGTNADPRPSFQCIECGSWTKDMKYWLSKKV